MKIKGFLVIEIPKRIIVRIHTISSATNGWEKH
jgi:hypothetical protein